MKELNVSIRLSDKFVLIGNQPFPLWVTTTTGLLPVGLFIQNLIIFTKVAPYERPYSDFSLCHLFLPNCW
jgi:hypothetical protein